MNIQSLYVSKAKEMQANSKVQAIVLHLLLDFRTKTLTEFNLCAKCY
jgi:hypothetical protein